MKLTSKSFSGYPPRSVDALGVCGKDGTIPRSSRSNKGSDVMNAGEYLNGVENPNKSFDREREMDVTKVKVKKKKVRALMPTSKQLASLNLKEGKNIVIFTFSTSMLGDQQVSS